MKATELKKIKDNSKFKLSKTSEVWWTLQTKLKGADKGYCYITTTVTGITRCKYLGTTVWVEKD